MLLLSPELPITRNALANLSAAVVATPKPATLSRVRLVDLHPSRSDLCLSTPTLDPVSADVEFAIPVVSHSQCRFTQGD